jgi:hypothetical protein
MARTFLRLLSSASCLFVFQLLLFVRLFRNLIGHLNLHDLNTVLPDDDVGGNTVLTVVEQDDAVWSDQQVHCRDRSSPSSGRCVHVYIPAIRILRLASVELEVLEVGDKLLLDVSLGALLESSDLFSGSALLLELGLDSLHVTCREYAVSRDFLCFRLLNGKTHQSEKRDS